MNKMLKAGTYLITLILVLTLVFYFWGSSGWIPSEDYNKLTTYGEERIPKDTLSVMSYNLGYLSGMTNNRSVTRAQELFDSNLSQVNSLLTDQKPDIIGFQEIDFDSDRSKNVNQMKAIATYVGYYQSFSSLNWDKRYVPFPYLPVKAHFVIMP